MRGASTWIDIVTLLLIVVGAINWGIYGATKGRFDLVQGALGKRSYVSCAVFVIVGISALVHVFSRDYYLPFLGKAAFPCGPLEAKEPKDADTAVRVIVPPGASVVYWAAETPNEVDSVAKNPWLAYGRYTNAGVAIADQRGLAVMRVRRPGRYEVRGRWGRPLRAHVHYRTCDGTGSLGPVRTVDL
jgi:uncharacterized membrane protein YuzA (DUF378 family)